MTPLLCQSVLRKTEAAVLTGGLSRRGIAEQSLSGLQIRTGPCVGVRDGDTLLCYNCSCGTTAVQELTRCCTIMGLSEIRILEIRLDVQVDPYDFCRRAGVSVCRRFHHLLPIAWPFDAVSHLTATYVPVTRRLRTCCSALAACVFNEDSHY
jgi:hypothetical protein